MPDITNIELSADHSVAVEPAGGAVTVKVTSNGPVYYSDSQQVSSANNQGSITNGNSQTFTSQVWIIGSTGDASGVQLTVFKGSATGGAGPTDIVLGSDGKIGGPGGTALTNTFIADADAHVPLTIKGHSAGQSVDLLKVTDSSSNALFEVQSGGQVVLTPSATGNPLFNFTVPDLVPGVGALTITDGAGNQAPLIRLQHSGSGGGSTPYGINLRNVAGADSAVVVHQYSNSSPSVILDNVQNQATVMIRNAQNASEAAGVHGTAAYFDLRGYFVYDTTAATGAVTGTNTLTDTTTPAAFVAEDVGKQIKIAAVTTTIASVVSPTQVTTSGSIVNGTGVTYSYAKNPGQMALQDNALKWTNFGVTPFKFTTSAGGAEALHVSGVAASALPALQVDHAGTGNAVNVNQTGAAVAVQIFQSAAQNALNVSMSGAQTAVRFAATSGAAGFFPFVVAGQDYGPSFTTSTDGGTSLTVSKAGAGAGTVVSITNAGTGDSLNVAAGTTMLRVNSTGLGFYGTAPVAKQAISGALSTVTDAAAKAVLTSIISALSTPGLATNSTT